MSRKTMSPENTRLDRYRHARLVSVKLTFAHARKRRDRRNEKLRGEVARKRRKKNEERERRKGNGGAKRTANNAIPLPMEGRNGRMRCARNHLKKFVPSHLSFSARLALARHFPPFYLFTSSFCRKWIKVRPRLPRLSVFSKLNLIDSSNRATFVKSADTSGLIVTIIFDECLINCSMMLYIALLHFIVTLWPHTIVRAFCSTKSRLKRNRGKKDAG